MELLIRQQAAKLRKEQGYYETDAIDLHVLLRRNEILTVFKKLNPNFSGMTIKVENKFFVLINSDHSVGRQNFTICHELYHIFIEKDFESHLCKTGEFNKRLLNEYKADLFASFFLLPEEGLMKNIPEDQLSVDSIKLDTILYIENLYQVSRSALLRRLKELKLISNPFYQSLNFSIRKNALRFGYPTTLYEAGNDGLIIGDYGMKASKLFDEEKISQSTYAELMELINVNIFDNNNCD